MQKYLSRRNFWILQAVLCLIAILVTVWAFTSSGDVSVRMFVTLGAWAIPGTLGESRIVYYQEQRKKGGNQ
jgi:uncharacterized membrane protein YhaH (DUF805 family)